MEKGDGVVTHLVNPFLFLFLSLSLSLSKSPWPNVLQTWIFKEKEN